MTEEQGEYDIINIFLNVKNVHTERAKNEVTLS